MQFCLFGAPQAEGGASGVAASLQQNTNSSVALYSGTVVAKRSDDVGLDVNFLHARSNWLDLRPTCVTPWNFDFSLSDQNNQRPCLSQQENET